MNRNLTTMAGRYARRRGTATLEFVMCVPLFALIIALTFFFGWAMTNQQHVKVSSRYKAWRDVRTSEGVTGGKLNRLFFEMRASTVDTDSDNGISRTHEDMVSEVGAASTRAEPLARATVWDRFPRGRWAEVAAEFPTDVGAWKRFTGAIEHEYSRSGVQWLRGEANCRGAVGDLYLDGLDQTLQSVPSPGQGLAGAIRALYLNGW